MWSHKNLSTSNFIQHTKVSSQNLLSIFKTYLLWSPYKCNDYNQSNIVFPQLLRRTRLTCSAIYSLSSQAIMPNKQSREVLMFHVSGIGSTEIILKYVRIHSWAGWGNSLRDNIASCGHRQNWLLVSRALLSEKCSLGHSKQDESKELRVNRKRVEEPATTVSQLLITLKEDCQMLDQQATCCSHVRRPSEQ